MEDGKKWAGWGLGWDGGVGMEDGTERAGLRAGSDLPRYFGDDQQQPQPTDREAEAELKSAAARCHGPGCSCPPSRGGALLLAITGRGGALGAGQGGLCGSGGGTGG